MDYIRLRYNETALPVLTDRNGEAIGNWTAIGNHSIVASATYAHSGSKSYAISASGAGSWSNCACIPESAHSPTLTVGKKYCIGLWAKGSGAQTFYITAGGVVSSAFTVTTEWAYKQFVLTSIDASYWLAIYIASPTNVLYVDDITIYEYEDFNLALGKGLKRPDAFGYYPKIKNLALDGSESTQYRAFIRRSIIETQSLTDAQMLAYLYWGLDNDRLLDYSIGGTAEYGLLFNPESEQEFVWNEDCDLMPYLSINMNEGVARTTFPV